MKQLIRAWIDYKESLNVGPVCKYGGGAHCIFCRNFLPASFEGFMDYLVRKEKPKKRKLRFQNGSVIDFSSKEKRKKK